MKALSVPGVAAGPAGPGIADLWLMIRELEERVDTLEAENKRLSSMHTMDGRGPGGHPAVL